MSYHQINTTLNVQVHLCLMRLFKHSNHHLFGMMIYVHQYCIERERENKLKELAIAYALLKKEEQDRQDELLEKE